MADPSDAAGKEHESVLFLSVVIPAYNEEKNIVNTLDRVRSYLTSHGYVFEIIVVNDGSQDDTEFLVECFSSGNKDISLISYTPNRGKGYAVKMGVLCSKGEYLLITDADLSTPIEESDRLISLCQGSVDIAFGSRALAHSDIEVTQKLFRRIMGRVFNAFVRLVALPGVSDTQCGFKCLKGRVARELFESQLTEGFAFDVELLLRAKGRGYELREVPIRWIDKPSSTVRPLNDSISMLADVLRIKKWLR